ncbi:MAG: transglutaminase family protein [Candidatus Thermoplasmatota archaeon]|nr:transglutaminase family protein [Candidatus Thermoplasmatota archaeon]
MRRSPPARDGTQLFVLVLVVLISLPSVMPLGASSQETKESMSLTPASTTDQELYLLRVEHYLYVTAEDDVGVFHVRYSFPPDYEYQVPLLLEVYNNSTLSSIIHYHIEDDSLPPNKVVNFTLEPMQQGEMVLLHFTCWVLVRNHDFSDLPPYVKFPKKYQLPDETKTWLASTEMVQLHSLLIRRKAHQLHGLSDNLIRYAGRIAPFIRSHRFWLFSLQYYTGLLISQDARTTLLFNGENVGRAHLACAFFRLYHTPARVLLVNNDQGFWTQMHYMAEYYCPGYGWVLVETTFGKSPYETKHQVINRICYPEDEDDTKRDYIYPLMRGEERWLWIDTEVVVPYYVDCDEGSKSQMFTEGVAMTDQLTASYAFVLSQQVFRSYQQYLGENLTGENLLHFDNAVDNQTAAVLSLKQYSDVEGYLAGMNQAYDEYLQIII